MTSVRWYAGLLGFALLWVAVHGLTIAGVAGAQPEAGPAKVQPLPVRPLSRHAAVVARW